MNYVCALLHEVIHKRTVHQVRPKARRLQYLLQVLCIASVG